LVGLTLTSAAAGIMLLFKEQLTAFDDNPLRYNSQRVCRFNRQQHYRNLDPRWRCGAPTSSMEDSQGDPGSNCTTTYWRTRTIQQWNFLPRILREHSVILSPKFGPFQLPLIHLRNSWKHSNQSKILMTGHFVILRSHHRSEWDFINPIGLEVTQHCYIYSKSPGTKRFKN
jgi:hypothetical protein